MGEEDGHLPEGGGGSAAPDGVAGHLAADGGEAAAAGNARERREQRRYGEVAREAAALRERVRALEARLAEAEEAGNRNRVAALERDLEAAQADARRAFADGDPEGHVKAVRQVAEIAASKVVATAPVARAAPSQPQAPRFTPTTQAWMDANPWFNVDEAATRTARAAHGQAVAAGMVADTPEYWSFIKTKVERVHPGLVREPEGFGTGDPPDGGGDGDGAASSPAVRQPSGAAPVTRPQAGSSRPGGELRLTAEQVEAAKIAGVSPQQYAAALRAGQKTGAFVPAVRR